MIDIYQSLIYHRDRKLRIGRHTVRIFSLQGDRSCLTRLVGLLVGRHFYLKIDRCFIYLSLRIPDEKSRFVPLVRKSQIFSGDLNNTDMNVWIIPISDRQLKLFTVKCRQ